MTTEVTIPIWVVIVIILMIVIADLFIALMVYRLAKERDELLDQDEMMLAENWELAEENANLKLAALEKPSLDETLSSIVDKHNGALFSFTTEHTELRDDTEYPPVDGRALIVFDKQGLSSDLVEQLADSVISGEWNRLHMDEWTGE